MGASGFPTNVAETPSFHRALGRLDVVALTLMALCTVKVASRYDVTGGPMYCAKDAFGPVAGFIIGWLMYLSRLAAFGAIASVMLDYAAGLWPSLTTQTARARRSRHSSPLLPRSICAE